MLGNVRHKVTTRRLTHIIVILVCFSLTSVLESLGIMSLVALKPISDKKVEEFTNLILPIMERANLPMVPLKVDLKVDVGSGNNWAEAH